MTAIPAQAGAIEKGLRLAAIIAVAAMLSIYYARGLSFQLWPDSGSYLMQAQGLAAQGSASRVADRNVGYPALVALALATPWPALVIVAVQALATLLAFLALYRAVASGVLQHAGVPERHHRLIEAALLAGFAAASLYSVLHVQIAALLTETIFTALALAALLAVTWLVGPGRIPRRPWLEAAATGLLVAVPSLLKPHWQLAALLLAGVIGFWLWRTTRVAGQGVPRNGVRLALALALPLAVIWLATLPDRYFAERLSPRAHALFGPRTAFCNHAHLISATLARKPGLTLQDDAAFERMLRERLSAIVASHRSGWRLLGFNGDLCSYDAELTTLLDRRYPEPQAQRTFLLGSLMHAALADPLPYARKVLAQMAHGFLTAFGRFAIHARPGVDYAAAAANFTLAPGFTAGVTYATEVGPLGSKAALDGTTPGRIVQGLLALIFTTATAALVVATFAAVILPIVRWRTWDAHRRHAFQAFVALPLAVLLAHHALIALVHTFDVWRYGFNMFFVNLYLIAAVVLFVLGERHSGA